MRTAAAVVVALVALAVWVDRVFVPGWLVRRYRDPPPVLSDRTQGRSLALVVAAVPPRTPDELRIVVVRDGAGPAARQESIALAAALGPASTGRRPVVVDLTVPELLATDALLLGARALALDPDLVVVGVVPRLVPVAPARRFATSAPEMAFERAVVARLGLGTLVRLVGPLRLVPSVVTSLWAPARLRVALAEAASEAVGLRWPATHLTEPEEPSAAGSPPDALPGLDPPSLATEALEHLIALCGRSGRCFLYAPPADAGSGDDLVAWTRRRTVRAHVPFLDLRAAPGDALARLLAPEIAERTLAPHP